MAPGDYTAGGLTYIPNGGDPVHFFAAESPQANRSLRARLKTEIANQCSQLAAGSAQDWPDYQKRVGRILGMNDALTMLDEIEKDQR